MARARPGVDGLAARGLFRRGLEGLMPFLFLEKGSWKLGGFHRPMDEAQAAQALPTLCPASVWRSHRTHSESPGPVLYPFSQ